MKFLKRFRKKFVPTDMDVYNACLTYRHDYGLMTAHEQNMLRREAVEWLKIWEEIKERK